MARVIDDAIYTKERSGDYVHKAVILCNAAEREAFLAAANARSSWLPYFSNNITTYASTQAGRHLSTDSADMLWLCTAIYDSGDVELGTPILIGGRRDTEILRGLNYQPCTLTPDMFGVRRMGDNDILFKNIHGATVSGAGDWMFVNAVTASDKTGTAVNESPFENLLTIFNNPEAIKKAIIRQYQYKIFSVRYMIDGTIDDTAFDYYDGIIPTGIPTKYKPSDMESGVYLAESQDVDTRYVQGKRKWIITRSMRKAPVGLTWQAYLGSASWGHS